MSIFEQKKKKISNRGSLLNNSIENNNIDKLDSQNKNIGFFSYKIGPLKNKPNRMCETCVMRLVTNYILSG